MDQVETLPGRTAAADPLNERLARAAAELPPITCFANDWHGDPTSKHHIMRILGRHTPVLWVESSGMRRPNLGNRADLARIGARLRRAFAPGKTPHAEADRLPTADSGVQVISPLSVPLPGNRIAEWINARMYRRAVELAGPKGAAPLLWIYTPTVAPYLDRMPHSGIVYHCVDRWWAFTEYDAAVMRRHHEDLCRKADVVFASATELLEDCRQFAPDAVLMRHGVDWDHFASAVRHPAPERPADIAEIETPILGFFGLLHDWIDQDLLVQVATTCPAATLVLIGKAPVDITRLTALPNVRWLGQKPFSQLPAYAAAFDVALVPFVRNDLTAAVNPIKLLEYLSAGIPVLATALPEISRIAPRTGLHVAETGAEFLRLADRLVAERGAADRRAISDAQREESWEGRCLAMIERIRSATLQRSG